MLVAAAAPFSHFSQHLTACYLLNQLDFVSVNDGMVGKEGMGKI